MTERHLQGVEGSISRIDFLRALFRGSTQGLANADQAVALCQTWVGHRLLAEVH